ncbi:MAG: hypothetical protein ABEJ79_10240 [Halolamina sp.]
MTDEDATPTDAASTRAHGHRDGSEGADEMGEADEMDGTTLSDAGVADSAAVTGGSPGSGSNPEPDSEDLVTALRTLRRRVDDLDAGLQAVRGVLGEINAIDRDVERRADLALARTDRLRDRVAALEGDGDDGSRQGTDAAHGDGSPDASVPPGSAATVRAKSDRAASETRRAVETRTRAMPGGPSASADSADSAGPGDGGPDDGGPDDGDERGLAERLREVL